MPHQTTTTRLFLFLRQEFPAFSQLTLTHRTKIMLLCSLCCVSLGTAAAAKIARPTPPAPARGALVPASFVFPGSLPPFASAAQTRRSPRQAVQRRDGRTVSFFSLSKGSTTTTTTAILTARMARRCGHGMAGGAKGQRRAGGGGKAGVTRSRIPPSPSTSSSRSLGSATGVLWGVGGEVGGGGDGGLGDHDSEIKNERDANDDIVDVPSEQSSSLTEKEIVDGSTGAPRVGTVSFSDGKGPSTPPPPLVAFGKAERPAGSGEAPPSRRGRSDSTEWMPQLFPPSSPEDDESFVKPLIELPLDGILLQLFPALLIGVLGLFLTIAIQVEASRFDGMVGEDGGAVVVTDLRETRKAAGP